MGKGGKREREKRAFFYVGVALVLLSIVVLIINIVLGLAFRDDLFMQLVKSKEYKEAALKYGDDLIKDLNNLLIFFCFMWIVITILALISLIAINKDEKNWFYFSMLGLLSIFTFRFEVGILMFISSLLFWIEKNKKNKR